MEPEKIRLITKVVLDYKHTVEYLKKFEDTLDVSFEDSEFYLSVLGALDDLVDAVSDVAGDHMRWIHWFIASGFGKRPIKAKGREIRTIDDLIWLIDECGKQQPE
jgi:hypothetical protein